MDLFFSPTFDRRFETRLTPKQRRQIMDAIELFIKNPEHPNLRNHRLEWGRWKGQWSISVGGDLRMHYEIISENRIYFTTLGTHEELYRDL